MEATLNKTELETLAKMVTDKLYAKFIAEGSQKELQKACEDYTRQLIKFYISENAVHGDVEKMIKPIFDEHIKKSRIVEDQLSAYMNTEHFKKLELKHLEQRVSQIKYELSNNEED